MRKIYEALNWASSFLEENGREPFAAELLLRHELGVDRTGLFMKMRDGIPEAMERAFVEKIKAHATGIPLQHLTGTESFYGREFTVNEHVLIPRPETEELVLGVIERSAKLFPGSEPLSLVDVGTGSGAIAISLALELERSNVTAIDISEEALKVAKQNAINLRAEVSFLHGDLLQPIIEQGKRFDIVVSNPPYISQEDYEQLDPLVRDHEPITALVGGEDGYELYRKLAHQIPKVLAPKGIIAFEVGEKQAKTVAGFLEASFGNNIKTEIVKDINGKQRMVFGQVG
ncbi:peptide chain release factor N(5)-glutamine methyltransferase [Pseudalkalibacillus caeni]|uniref:Release factor glutamine methyltransferase n=1 Tax=Exobacillus caeni TaxID=2574798 RepID=A0A5R9FAQ1_9BACL|nr:peptide chain release factor N(5)-glutamine methyltransferase [Pseudalkalibacillus caeni]TLS36705.1 peptide chain release factor N(5)-glutamine methyltransferase [Pseudalkalibacillus caeni]